MFKTRVIPRLDIKGPNVVKGIHIEGLRVMGSPLKFGEKFYQDGADEIIYMDIVASLYQRSLDFEQLKNFCENVFVPVTVGGGIRSINDINNALRAGADKIAINTYAINHPDFLTEAAQKFGSQCIVLSIEAKRNRAEKWEAYTDGGREHTGVDAVDWAKEAIKRGVGEILVTSIDQDGTRKGYELDLVRAITKFAPIPVIAHGGAGGKDTFKQVVAEAQADAVCASSVFQYGDYSIKELKEYLNAQGLKIRTL